MFYCNQYQQDTHNRPPRHNPHSIKPDHLASGICQVLSVLVSMHADDSAIRLVRVLPRPIAPAGRPRRPRLPRVRAVLRPVRPALPVPARQAAHRRPHDGRPGRLRRTIELLLRRQRATGRRPGRTPRGTPRVGGPHGAGAHYVRWRRAGPLRRRRAVAGLRASVEPWRALRRRNRPHAQRRATRRRPRPAGAPCSPAAWA